METSADVSFTVIRPSTRQPIRWYDPSRTSQQVHGSVVVALLREVFPDLRTATAVVDVVEVVGRPFISVGLQFCVRFLGRVGHYIGNWNDWLTHAMSVSGRPHGD